MWQHRSRDSIVYKRWLQTADEIKKFKDQEGVAELSRDNFRHPFKEHLTVSPLIQMDDKGEEKMEKQQIQVFLLNRFMLQIIFGINMCIW